MIMPCAVEYHGIHGPRIDNLLHSFVFSHSYVELLQGIPPNGHLNGKMMMRNLNCDCSIFFNKILVRNSPYSKFVHSMPDWFQNAEPWYAHTPCYAKTSLKSLPTQACALLLAYDNARVFLFAPGRHQLTLHRSLW